MDHGTEEVERIPRRQLLMLDANGRACEVCGRHMHRHQWADMDPDGFVVACSEEPGRVLPPMRLDDLEEECRKAREGQA